MVCRLGSKFPLPAIAGSSLKPLGLLCLRMPESTRTDARLAHARSQNQRRSPAIAVAFMLATLAGLSGCTDQATSTVDLGEPNHTITDPRDLSYLANATPGSHIHDYWGGRSSIRLLEVSWNNNSWACSSCPEGMPFAAVRPPQGLIVPQGTKWVNGTFTIAPGPDDNFERLELWYRTAADTEFRLGGPLESGKPFSIDSSKEQNDPPHYVLSLWQFSVRAYGAGRINASGDMSWSVDAMRGLPLEPYPPHPDRWQGATELRLLDVTGSTLLVRQMNAPVLGQGRSCTNGCPQLMGLPAGIVVPFDAARVVVRLELDGGLPAGVSVFFHGSNTWNLTRPAGHMGSLPNETIYEIELQPGMGDSPYAPNSLWEFLVWLDQPQPAFQAWSGQYRIEAHAFKD